jgi:putative ubiquitin-RnfH superfamily antitoxin RatB of RatAB toxin-antitoxin module
MKTSKMLDNLCLTHPLVADFKVARRNATAQRKTKEEYSLNAIPTH